MALLNSGVTVFGKIVRLNCSDTRFGYRAQARLERIDMSSGEVFEYDTVAWKEEAYALDARGLGHDIAVTGYWRKQKSDDEPRLFNAKHVNAVRLIDPRTVDLSKYLGT